MKWLFVVGIGEEGLSGLGSIARSLVDQAEVLVGGRRHLAMLDENDNREKIVWGSPIQDTVKEIVKRRPSSVCVLASGDPMCCGIGVTLTRFVDISEMIIIPAPSAFSLACARLGWSLTDVETLSLCGRPIELANSYFYPGAKLLILSADKKTPGIIANSLTNSGFCESEITILERMGGNNERVIRGRASESENFIDIADLNTIAVECIADAGVTGLSRLAGLPDNAYHHDGQLTKREVRAVTLAALAPKPGEVLWDVGAGCGSISIEWMRSHPSCRAIAIEQNASRLIYISDNAASLGTPYIDIVQGKAPDALEYLPTPNVIFIGGGVTSEGVLETCWQALPKNGRLVANVVTIEGEQKLFAWYQRVGGELSRIAIQRAEPIGKFMGWKAMAPVTQLSIVKS
jgi:precorrin-6B C5,15-methyltransferase / cobalt-precorrin-6B C5,C15-methyltransferase